MRTSLKSIALLTFVLPWIVGASGCPNAFQEMANTKTDEALLFQAQRDIDVPDYPTALATLAKASATAQASRRGRVLAASAYAGRCGLNLLNLANRLQNLGSSTLFPVLLDTYKTVASGSTAPADCYSAEQSLLAIPSADVTRDDYVFLAFNGLAKIGTLLAKIADTNDDGTVDGPVPGPAFDPCAISDADAGQVGTGLTLALLGIQNSGLSIGAIGTVATLCSNLATLTGSASICQKTTPASFTASELLAFRAVMKGNEIGFNTCGGATGSAGCTCP